ncbi:MAG: GAF domain-containing protein [Vulcanimicrobiota bacterium]
MDLGHLSDVLSDRTMALESRLKFCLSKARRFLDAERGCLLVMSTGHETMLYDGDEELNLKFPFSRNVVGQAMTGRTVLVSFDSPGELHGDSVSSMKLHGVRAALCTPLLGPQQQDLGVIYFDSRVGTEFDEAKIARVEELARAISIALA